MTDSVVITKLGPFEAGQVLLVRNLDAEFLEHFNEELLAHCKVAAEERGLNLDREVPASAFTPLVISLHGDQTLAVLSDEEMAKGGWVRKGRTELPTTVAEADTFMRKLAAAGVVVECSTELGGQAWMLNYGLDD